MTLSTIRPGARYGPRAIRAASTVPSPPYEHFNIETGVDPFGVFRTVDYGDVNISPGDVVESHRRMTNKVKEVFRFRRHSCYVGRRSFNNFCKRTCLCQEV